MGEVAQLFVITTANQKFCAAVTVDEPGEIGAFLARQRVSRLWINQHRWPGRWRWVRIGANTWDLRSPDGITRYQLFRYEPRSLTWRNDLL